MSHVALSMTFSNNTFDTWYRDYYGYQDQKGLSGLSSCPGQSCRRIAGSRRCQWRNRFRPWIRGPSSSTSAGLVRRAIGLG
jgi:hypothetical protein